ncbi:MAG TPA: hypothetical protein VI756_02305 [Blastocatellia bacterium]
MDQEIEFHDGVQERELLRRLRAGGAIRFSVARELPSDWLGALIEGIDRTLLIPVSIENAILVGDIRLFHAIFESSFALVNCQVQGRADFTFSTFKRDARFKKTRFEKPPTLSGMRAEHDFEIDGAVFPDGSVLNDLKVNETLSATRAEFGACDLGRIEVRKFVDFTSARFGGKLTFEDGRISGDAKFHGAQFAEADFHGLTTGGSLLFTPAGAPPLAVRFAGPANFYQVKVGKDANFYGATFERSAIFASCEVGGSTVFVGAQFGGTDREIAVFADAVLSRDANFGPDTTVTPPKPVRFGGDSWFDSVRILGNANFLQAEFGAQARFHMARVGGQAQFSKAVFSERVLISSTQASERLRAFPARISAARHPLDDSRSVRASSSVRVTREYPFDTAPRVIARPDKSDKPRRPRA